MAGDVVAGLTLAAVAIPDCIGYAKIAGTPVVTGLYIILLPVVAFALLGSSRHRWWEPTVQRRPSRSPA